VGAVRSIDKLSDMSHFRLPLRRSEAKSRPTTPWGARAAGAGAPAGRKPFLEPCAEAPVHGVGGGAAARKSLYAFIGGHWRPNLFFCLLLVENLANMDPIDAL
jgi:hypothetical protein